MEKCLISIIIPVYNAEKYLSRCIDSIIAQTYEKLEIILVNDGSIDNSSKICNEYANKDNRIKVYNQKNTGASATRNLGIKNANGRFISFIDSDDWVDKKYIDILYNNIVNNEANLSVCGYQKVSNIDEAIPIENTSGNIEIYDKKQTYKRLINNDFGGFLWRKNVFK